MSYVKHVVLCSCGHSRFVIEKLDLDERVDFLKRKLYYETEGKCKDCTSTFVHSRIYVVYDKSRVVVGHLNSTTKAKGGPRVSQHTCVLAEKAPKEDVENALRRQQFWHTAR